MTDYKYFHHLGGNCHSNIRKFGRKRRFPSRTVNNSATAGIFAHLNGIFIYIVKLIVALKIVTPGASIQYNGETGTAEEYSSSGSAH